MLGDGVLKKDAMRRFFFLTIHHFPDGTPLPSDEDELIHLDVSEILDAIDGAFLGNLRYRRATLEIGEEKGRFHVHAYVELFRSVRWSTVVKRTSDMMAKVKLVSHSRDKVHEYCGKTDDPTFLAGPWDVGHRIQQRVDESAKSALDEVLDRAMDGVPIQTLATEYPKTWVIFGRRIKEWLLDVRGYTPETEEPQRRPYR
jgi:hypothetical protein